MQKGARTSATTTIHVIVRPGGLELTVMWVRENILFSNTIRYMLCKERAPQAVSSQGCTKAMI